MKFAMTRRHILKIVAGSVGALAAKAIGAAKTAKIVPAVNPKKWPPVLETVDFSSAWRANELALAA